MSYDIKDANIVVYLIFLYMIKSFFPTNVWLVYNAYK